MPTYDFTHLVDRRRMNSSKWNAMLDANPHVPEGIAPLSVADMDFRPAPEIVRGLQRFLDEAVLGYTATPESYTQAVINWMAKRHAWSIDAEWMVESDGVVTAFFNAIRAFSKPGEGVIIQTPAYYPFYAAIEENGRKLAANPLLIRDGQYVIDFDHLERLARDPNNKILLFCSPHNPTGRVWTGAELAQVADIAKRHGLILISDEIHFDLVMPGYQHTVMSKVDEAVNERLIVCTAPSKTFNLAGLSTSNIIIPNPEVRERFNKTRAATGFHRLTTLGYEACELAYTQCEDWLDELIQLIWHNHQLVKKVLAQRLPDIKVFELEGTYLQWIDMRGLGKTAEQLQRINEQQAFLYFDEGTMFGEDGAGFERINLGTPTQVLEDALERLSVAYT